MQPVLRANLLLFLRQILSSLTIAAVDDAILMEIPDADAIFRKYDTQVIEVVCLFKQYSAHVHFYFAMPVGADLVSGLVGSDLNPACTCPVPPTVCEVLKLWCCCMPSGQRRLQSAGYTGDSHRWKRRWGDCEVSFPWGIPGRCRTASATGFLLTNTLCCLLSDCWVELHSVNFYRAFRWFQQHPLWCWSSVSQGTTCHNLVLQQTRCKFQLHTPLFRLNSFWLRRLKRVPHCYFVSLPPIKPPP